MLTQGAANDINLGRGGSYSSARDVLKHRVWDTWLVPAAVVNTTFFVQPQGSAFGAGVKAINETNMINAGQLPNGQTFLIKRLGLALISALPAASVVPMDVVQGYYNILQSSVWEIVVAGRSFDAMVHGRDFIPSVAVAGENAATLTSARFGDTIASGWVSLGDTPIFLDQQVNFNVALTIGNPIAATLAVINAGATVLNGLGSTLQVTLEGTLTRAK